LKNNQDNQTQRSAEFRSQYARSRDVPATLENASIAKLRNLRNLRN